MLIRAIVIICATAGAVGVVFALTSPVGAHPMKGCSAKYQAGAKAGPRTQCGTNAANALRAPPREITLGMGDVVSVTIFDAAAGGGPLPPAGGAGPRPLA